MTTSIPVLFRTDAYKLGHSTMYPDNLVRLYSNFTNRKSRIPGVDKVVNFGLQGFITEFIIEGFGEFFAASEDDVIGEYEEMMLSVFGPESTPNTDHIRALHRLGYVPLRFSQLPEGTRVPLGVPAITVENTVEGFGWLTNYVESALSASIWHPSTVATLAYRMRSYLDESAVRSGAPEGMTDFQMHDFSFRGQTSISSAAASGAGHLLSSLGSDSVPSYSWVKNCYGGDAPEYMILGSVPASEHSVMCSYASVEFDENGLRLDVDETETYRTLLARFPTGILSLVSDTYDLFAAVRLFAPDAGNGLYEALMSRDGKVVFRPDSGDPDAVVNGDPDAPAGSDENKGLMQVCWELFGGTVTETGHKMLDDHVGIIYGDGIYYDRMVQMTEHCLSNGFASQLVLGVGSYAYQMCTRDVFNSAMKATYAEFQEGDHVVGRALMKDPRTDSGTKRSARGLLAVRRDENDELVLVQDVTREDLLDSEIQPVWENGNWVRYQKFSEVREVLASQK